MVVSPESAQTRCHDLKAGQSCWHELRAAQVPCYNLGASKAWGQLRSWPAKVGVGEGRRHELEARSDTATEHRVLKLFASVHGWKHRFAASIPTRCAAPVGGTVPPTCRCPISPPPLPPRRYRSSSSPPGLRSSASIDQALGLCSQERADALRNLYYLMIVQSPFDLHGSAMAELGRLLIYEATRDWLPTVSGEIDSPMGEAAVEFIDPREPVAIVPILRAGLALSEHASTVLPATITFHLGMRRDETTLEPSIYLNNLPDQFPEGSRILVLDPMLATGGTIVAAIDLLKDRGVNNKQMKIISAVAAPPALQKLSKKFPGLHVYSGMLDPIVNEKGFIIPGLGDAGDRSFGT
ncbi:hypothetical protein ZIOFF_064953 [Zingiber officinale]|uniref:uracil phosphoribosyltransferase n=1 Tax=Zingiber officinale TaxID=94328 RepID=A0A8J5K6V0_ZINOF|nr:hypothetical protein ZIOFF_064953 [Zingiber officinale]